MSYFQVDGATGTKYTYSDVLTLSVRVASNLAKVGLRRGDVLCVIASNMPEHALLLLAMASIGGILTIIHPAVSVGEFSRFLWDTPGVW